MTKQIPQGYKKTKVGIIPEDWEVVKLSKIVQHTVRDTKKPDVGYWRLGLRSHGKGTFHEYIEDPKKIAMETLYKVNENDLIINITFAWEHAIAIANKNDHGKLVSHRFPTYQFINENYHVFYKYYVLQEKFRLLLENISPGGAGRNRVMSKKSFLDLAIICPPVIEQNKIAEILSTWDDAITKQKQLIEQKQVFKKGIMQQIFSQKISFKDDNGSDYHDWQTKKLGDVFNGLKGGNLSKNDLVETGTNECILYGELYTKYNEVIKTIMSKTNSENGVKSKINDLLVPASTTTTGIDLATATALNKDGVLLGGDITILRAKITIDNIFYAYYLTHHKNQVLSCFAQGITIVHLYYTHFKDMEIYLPSLTEQTKIAELLTNIDDEITKQIDVLDQLKFQKQSLMQKLLTGQVRVKI